MPSIRQYGKTHPGRKWGPFTARIPFIHTRAEWPDFMQGLVVIASTSMVLVPWLQAGFGLSFEESVACAMIHILLLSMGPILFGDPFAPGYITPVLPITIAFVLGNYTGQTERFGIMTAITMDFIVLMVFFGVTGLGQKFITWMPNALKGGIILGASISSFKRVFYDDIDTFMLQPIATSAALVICLICAFSKPFALYKAKHKLVAKIANMGLLPGFIVACIVGVIAGEITFDIQWGFLIPPVDDVWDKASPFSIGWPSLEMLIAGIPVAFIGYIIAFGDLITGQEVIKEASGSRQDEAIDIDITRTHYSIVIRNIVMAITSPFFSTQGVVLTGVHVIVVQRWRQGREYMDSLFGGINSFYLFGLPFIFFLLPVLTALSPMMSIALSISFVLTGFACAYVAMAIPSTPEERGVALLTGVCLSLLTPWVGLLVGIVSTLLIVGFKSSGQEESSEDDSSPMTCAVS